MILELECVYADILTLLYRFVTGGTKSGVMKVMGEYRKQYNPRAPLIGVSAFGVLNGSERLRGIDLPNANADAKGPNANLDAKGWKAFGYDGERLPPVGERMRDTSEVDATKFEQRLCCLDSLEKEAKASGEVFPNF